MKDYDIDGGGGGAWFDLIFFNTTVFEIILIKVSTWFEKDGHYLCFDPHKLFVLHYKNTIKNHFSPLI